MIYFVSGAGGFIGKHVVKYLQDRGHEVISIPRPIRQFKLLDNKDFVFVHLAAYGNHYDHKDPATVINSNIFNLMYLLDMFKKTANCVKFYNVSTSAIQLPVQTYYTLSKHFGELLVDNLKDNRFVNVRPYSVYGPGEADHRFIPTVIRALHSGETIQLDPWAVHDWVHAEDFVDAMFKGYTKIGTGEAWTNLEVVSALEFHSGLKLNYHVSKLRVYDNAEWKSPEPVPGRSVYEGLKQTYECFTQKNIADKQEA